MSEIKQRSVEPNKAKDTNSYIDEVKRIVKEIKYGNLNLIIQDGKVIQIDKTEKIRL